MKWLRLFHFPGPHLIPSSLKQLFMKQILFAALYILPVCVLHGQTSAEIFIVRHADRTAGDDLNAAGLARAQELKRVLGGAAIGRIYSTDFVRTKKTAQPLADSLGLTTKIYSSIPTLIKDIKLNVAKKRHLVVGHSDTVDDIIAACGCTPPPAITPQMPITQFDNLFLVILTKTGAGALVTWSCEWMRMRYGAVTN